MNFKKKLLGISKKFGISKVSEDDIRKSNSYLRIGQAKIKDLTPYSINSVTEKYKAAVQYFNESIIYNPNNIEAYYLRGFAQLNSWSPKDSIKDFDKVLEMDPLHVKAYLDRARAFHSCELRNLSKDKSRNLNGSREQNILLEMALEYANEVELIDPNNIDYYWFKYDMFYRGRGKYIKELLYFLNRIIKIEPDCGKAYYEKADLLLFQKGSKNEILENFLKAHQNGYKQAKYSLVTYCDYDYDLDFD
jgi:tetratricopeptide (TPR) repeat protein